MDLLISPMTCSSSCSSSLRWMAKTGFSATPRNGLSGRFIKRFRSISTPREAQRQICLRSRIRASSSSESQTPPLQLESPIGQFLSEILVSHPHLLYAAVDQQLEQLQVDTENEKKLPDPGTEIVLYKRISEVKAKERRRAVEEILYTLVVQKFTDAGISLIPCLSLSSDPSGKVDQWPPQEEELRRIHSSEAFEMIQNHLAMILGSRSDSVAVAMSRFRVGQVYAASIMYGYFLKRVDQRFQLEKTMQSIPSLEEVGPTVDVGLGFGIQPTKLRAYVMGLDQETLQRCAMVRSKEALGLVERQTAALFGESTTVIDEQERINGSKDELIEISFGGLRRLIMEAVAFGSFLWDVETYVDSRHQLALNF